MRRLGSRLGSSTERPARPKCGWSYTPLPCRAPQRAKRARRSKRRPVGYTFLRVAVDDYSRVAYVEAHANETAATLVGFGGTPRTGSGPTTCPWMR